MDGKKQNYSKAALTFVAFILCFIFLAKKPLINADYDASAGYICLASIFSSIIALKISDFAILKKIVIALAALTLITLGYVYIDSLVYRVYPDGSKSINWSDFAGYESGNILVMILASILLYFAFYKYICKIEKQELEENEE